MHEPPGKLKFGNIVREEFRVGTYGQTAVVTGQTKMRGEFNGQPFGASSRYTDVSVERGRPAMVREIEGNGTFGEAFFEAQETTIEEMEALTRQMETEQKLGPQRASEPKVVAPRTLLGANRCAKNE